MSFLRVPRTCAYLGCLLGQLALFAVFNALWVNDSCFQLSVQPDSRIQVEVCLRLLGIGPIGDEAFPYSTLLPNLAMPFIHWLGLSKWPFFIVQMGFATVWVLATYLLGKEWFSPRTGLAAASLLLWSLQAAVMVRNYLLDYPAAAVFTLQVYFLLRSRYFTRPWPSLLFLILVPLLAAIKSHHLLCLAPVAAAFAVLLLKRDYPRLWGATGSFGLISGLMQVLTPLAFALLGLSCSCAPADYAMLFFTGMIAQNAWQSLALHRTALASVKDQFETQSVPAQDLLDTCITPEERKTNSRKTSGKHQENIRKVPAASPQARYSSFLLFLLGMAIALLISIYLLTRVFACGDAAVHARNNLGLPTLWQGDFSSTLQTLGYWLAGHITELKTKHLQLWPLVMYSVGLALALVRPRHLRGQAFLAYTTIFTSLLMSLCTYNSVRYEAPLLSLRCVLAVFWISCLPGLPLLKWSGRLLFAASLACGIFFNGAWLTSSLAPRANVQGLFNEFCLSNGEGTLKNFDVFDRAYDPQVRFQHTVSLGQQAGDLWGSYSAYGHGWLFTCDPYPIDWASCACGMRRAMHSPQEAAYLFVHADDLKDMLFLRSDEIQANLDYSYRVAIGASNMPIIPSAFTDCHSHFAAVATAPNASPPSMFGPTARLIYAWKCPQVALWLYKLDNEYVL